MKKSNKKDQKTKKVTEIKTFSVPFAIGEIKENIRITTNTLPEPSEETIIIQALDLHTKGNIPKAAELYQYLINQGYNDHRVFSNHGIILTNLGKLKEAELYTRKAIKIKPNFAEGHYNLGNILKDLGKFIEAELSYRKAIKIKPNFAECHYNLGNILKDLGKFKEAFDSYLKVTKINPKFPNIYDIITRFLSNSNPSQLNKVELKNILNLLLEKNDIRHVELFKVFNFLYNDEIINNLKKIESHSLNEDTFEIFLKDKIIINSLKKIVFKDRKLEKILTNIRKYFCDQIAEKKTEINQSRLEFIIALGEQCFLNEYIYLVTEEESHSLNIIIKRCIDGEINEKNISILSCYLSLYQLIDLIQSLESFNSNNKSFKELIKFQIKEPIQEIALSKSIKRLGSIKDNISQQVKSQYEKNPYPRWRYGNTSKDLKLSAEERINLAIQPNNINQNLEDNQLKILIAGCGTGQHILNVQQYKNAQITGIDLSLTSLSYAQRKINELKINNVKLIQMDILEVYLLEEKFDIIECSGVLHHMKDPSKGLKALFDILKPNGFLKLGLYSELARQDIVKARQYITTKKIPNNDKGIKDFREAVFSNKIEQISNLRNWSNLYTMSECRDLCFHYQEHRFTVKELQKILNSNNLTFLGFLLPEQVKSLYKKYFPEDKTQTNLQNWAKFEEKHSNTFRAMYQFWVSKTEN